MWTAISLWFLNVGGAALYIAWAMRMVDSGAKAWLFVVGFPLVYLGLLLFFVATYFIVAWWFRAKRPPDVRLTLRQRLALFANEYLALLASGPRQMFFRVLVRNPPPAPAAAPILLLHGVLCNAGVWTRFLRRLRSRGAGPVYALSYGPPLASIEGFAEQAEKTIDAILAETGAAKLRIVAHSMGGLVALAYMRRCGYGKVDRLITMGTPFYGSMHAWFAPGTSMAQMRPGNAWLAGLDASIGPAAVPIVALWSWHDSMVAPQTSALLRGAESIAVTGIGHNALLADRSVFERVFAALAR
jgi:triacylglycerol esterase/lipase EstA (alpha/beta hydrolase family)